MGWETAQTERNVDTMIINVLRDLLFSRNQPRLVTINLEF